MKSEKLIIAKVVSSLYQQGIISSKKKGLLLNAWNNKEKKEDILKELIALSSDKEDLIKILEKY